MKQIYFFIFIIFIPFKLLSHQSDLHKYPENWEKGKSYVNKFRNEDMTINLDEIFKPTLYIPEHDCEKQLELPANQVDCAGAKKRKNIAFRSYR